MVGRSVSLLDGNTFVLSDLAGNVTADAGEPLGLFAWDTRFLARWVLTLDGRVPIPLATDEFDHQEVQIILAPSGGTRLGDAALSVIRRRAVGAGFTEEITVRNDGQAPAEVMLRLDAGSDFADLFEVREGTKSGRDVYTRPAERRLTVSYTRGTFKRETVISASQPCQVDRDGFTFAVSLPAHRAWTVRLSVGVRLGSANGQGQSRRSGRGPRAGGGQDARAWVEAAPRLSCDWQPLERIYERSLADLAALRFHPRVLPGGSLVAAGLPWYMTVLGRDSIITSLQALPFAPTLARTTLVALADWQGAHTDDFRDEEPGKIPQELRYGELAAFEERPQSPYYGSADTTPLYLILLDEYTRWTDDLRLARDLEMTARAALQWIDQYGDRNGDGYVEYSRRNEATGLENQCWKDTGNSILFADGGSSKLPRATCEIQGYVYDAKVRCAGLARDVWKDADLAARLEAEAHELKRRFNHDFWLEDRQCFALALDGDHRLVDSLTSNIGHLLWSGIIDPGKTAPCVAHLMDEHLYSGWGVRTMAEGEGGYNPIGYHLGSVWPHDNSLIAWGLARRGYRREAARVAVGILQAASHFDGRLPEAVAGYPRRLTRRPVPHPTACSPRAWATAAPLLLLRVLLGLEPVNGRLLVDPAVPEELGSLEILDIPGAWGHADAYTRGLVKLSPASGEGGFEPIRLRGARPSRLR